MAKEVEIIVTAKDKASATFEKIGDTSKASSEKIKSSMNAIRIASGVAFAWIVAVWKKFIDDAMVSIEQETKLTTILKQRTNATQDQIDAIKDMTSAQQKLWIVEDDTQIAWLQQLWTFVSQANTLKVLWPAMNNLIAQQKWFNATQGDAINIWNLMWKVLMWQTWALTKVWITFTEAQEKVLKFGNEQERSAMLAQVITDNVWNMNEALWQTFQWRMTQLQNTLWSVGETIWTALIPIIQKLVEWIVPVIEKIAWRIEKNPELTANIMVVVGAVSAFSLAMTLIAPIITTVTALMSWLWIATTLLWGATFWPLWLVIAWVALLVIALTALIWPAWEATVWISNVSQASTEASSSMDRLKIAQENYNKAKLNTVEKQQALQELIAKTNEAIKAFERLQEVSAQYMKQDQRLSQTWATTAGAVAWFWTKALSDYIYAGWQVQKLKTDLKKLPWKAIGWNVWANQPYKVGEKGEELFVPHTSWKIIPNDKLWWNTSININMGWVVVNNEADENRLVQKISDVLMRQNQLYSLGIN